MQMVSPTEGRATDPTLSEFLLSVQTRLGTGEGLQILAEFPRKKKRGVGWGRRLGGDPGSLLWTRMSPRRPEEDPP